LERPLPVLAALAFAVSGWAVIHQLQSWHFTISTSAVIVAPGFAVARPRKLPEANNINPRPNRRFQRRQASSRCGSQLQSGTHH
jgi:hypothetical protein